MISEEVPAALAGERLDRFVSMVMDCSRSRAAALVDDGSVQIDGRVATAGKLRLETGQTVLISAAIGPEVVAVPEADSTIGIEVIHADDHIIVVDKPADLVVHPGAGNPGGTLVNALLADFPEIAAVGDPRRPGIVHRLDKGTTGLLVVARTQAAYEALVDMLGRREITREYLTLVWGVVENDRGVVDAAIGRSGNRRTRMAVTLEGKPARTHYEALARRDDDPAVSLLLCRLESGRTHQIRVHLEAIGHAVVGDETYGGARAALNFDRPALHAVRLAFVHPETGEPVEFTSPRPPDFSELIRSVLPGE